MTGLALQEPSTTLTTGWHRSDVLILVVLVTISATFSSLIQRRADPRFLVEPAGNDVWFEADLPVVADRMQHRWADQSRSSRHPLFPLLATIPVYALTTLHVSQSAALRTVIVGFAAGWSAVFYILLRGVTRRRVDALVFTALGHVTAAAMFWLPMPETYTLGSASVMTALALGIWDTRGARAVGWYVATAAFSLAVTTSNWLTGLAVVATRQSRGRSVQIAANSLCVVVVLWSAQHVVFPSADFFLGQGPQYRFVLQDGVAGVPGAARAVLFHSVVMPAIAIKPEGKWGPIMSVQTAPLLSSGLVGAGATLLWTGLLGFGCWTLATSRTALRTPLALALAGHLLVYGLYGEETFLYTLHVAPLLICVAALATETRARSLVLTGATILTALLAINNGTQLSRALAFFDIAKP